MKVTMGQIVDLRDHLGRANNRLAQALQELPGDVVQLRSLSHEGYATALNCITSAKSSVIHTHKFFRELLGETIDLKVR